MNSSRINLIISRLNKSKKGFLLGAAASAHQTEGNNLNDWTEFEKINGNIKNQEKSGLATNHYELFETDFKLMKELGLKAHRLSLEWSRIIPNPNSIDEKEIKHYRKVLLSLKENDLISFVTLHHFTSPVWFIEKGGFEKKENLEYWDNFVKIVCEKLGDLIDVFNTINEPNVYASTGYLQGEHAPGEKSLLKFFRVTNNLYRAHFRAVAIIREICPDVPVGIVKNLIHFTSKSKWNPIDRLITRITDWGFNSASIKALKKQKIPFGLSKIKVGDIGDFVGINYYIKMVCGLFLPNMMVPHDIEDNNLTQMGWGVNPECLKKELNRFNRSIDLPIIITENGIATENDDWRKEFILDHLEVITELIDNGMDIRGYFYWSNIDNFEWSEGFDPKFGLIKYDSEYNREIKPSGKFLGSLAKKVKAPDLSELSSNHKIQD